MCISVKKACPACSGIRKEGNASWANPRHVPPTSGHPGLDCPHTSNPTSRSHKGFARRGLICLGVILLLLLLPLLLGTWQPAFGPPQRLPWPVTRANTRNLSALQVNYTIVLTSATASFWSYAHQFYMHSEIKSEGTCQTQRHLSRSAIV
jgi:hypothetical protein